jgi:hypothetical protein
MRASRRSRLSTRSTRSNPRFMMQRYSSRTSTEIYNRQFSIVPHVIAIVIAFVGVVLLAGCSTHDAPDISDSTPEPQRTLSRDIGYNDCHHLERWSDSEKRVTCYRFSCRDGIWCMKD